VLTNDEPALSGTPQASQDNSIWKPFNNIKSQLFVLRENEGLHVKNITNTTVGTMSWVIIFSVETANLNV
jgi:hypothetical protein